MRQGDWDAEISSLTHLFLSLPLACSTSPTWMDIKDREVSQTTQLVASSEPTNLYLVRSPSSSTSWDLSDRKRFGRSRRFVWFRLTLPLNVRLIVSPKAEKFAWRLVAKQSERRDLWTKLLVSQVSGKRKVSLSSPARPFGCWWRLVESARPSRYVFSKLLNLKGRGSS